MAARTQGTTRLQKFCRALAGTTEDIKWGSNLVFSVGGKMYAVFDADGDSGFSFKVSDEAFEFLTERDGVAPAPYLARASWVKVEPPSALPPAFAEELLEEAHQIVAAKLPKKTRREIGLLEDDT